MFLTELNRIKTMIAEMLFPVDTPESLPKEYKFDDDFFAKFTLLYDKEKKRYIASSCCVMNDRYNPADVKNPYSVTLSIYCNRVAPKDMDTICADINATYWYSGRKNIEVKKTESIVPNEQFVDNMTMDEIEHVALVILKSIRHVVSELNKRKENHVLS